MNLPELAPLGQGRWAQLTQIMNLVELIPEIPEETHHMSRSFLHSGGIASERQQRPIAAKKAGVFSGKLETPERRPTWMSAA